MYFLYIAHIHLDEWKWRCATAQRSLGKDVPALRWDRILTLGLSIAQSQEQETCDL